MISPHNFGNFTAYPILRTLNVSNKKASLIAVIAVVVIFLIYDHFKPLSEEKIIAKQGIATVYLDNSYKNIDSTNAPEGTLLAQYSNRHDISVVVTGGYLDNSDEALTIESYIPTLIKDAPEDSTLTVIELKPELNEAYYTLTIPGKLYSWQRLKIEGNSMTVISVVSDHEEPKLDPMKILNEAAFGTE